MVPSTREWWQETWFSGAKSKFVKLGVLQAQGGSLRAAIDAQTITPQLERSFAGKSLVVAGMRKRTTLAAAVQPSALDEVSEASGARAQALRAQIETIKRQRG
jgi:hypothetical protein